MSRDSTPPPSQKVLRFSKNSSRSLPEDPPCVQESPGTIFIGRGKPVDDGEMTKSEKVTAGKEDFLPKKMASAPLPKSLDCRATPPPVPRPHCSCQDASSVTETKNGPQTSEVSNETTVEDQSSLVVYNCDCSHDLGQIGSPNPVITAAAKNVPRDQETTEMTGNFEEILKNSPTDLRALAGCALVAFQCSNYSKSLECFQKILRNYPACSAEIRMWIGYCFCKLGSFEKSQIAFERALQLDEECVGAEVGLAFLKALDGKTAESMSLLTIVLEESPGRAAAALSNLCEEFCVALELASSESIVKLVLEKSTEKKLKSLFAWTFAKRYHVQEMYDAAFQFYQTAVEFSPPDSVLPLYGLAQIYLQRLNLPKAAECFQAVLALHPDCVDAMRPLGMIYNRLGCSQQKTVSRSYLTQAAEKFPEDTDLLVKLGEELECVDKEKSLETYLAVYDFLKSNGKSDDLSVQLLNNISALCFVLGDFHRSNEFLTLALAKLENDEELALDHSMMTTLLYNKGRLCEVFSDWNSAEDSYLRVLAAHPAYVDAYLRLGHVASSKGDSEEADFWFAEAAALDPENPEPSILQGDLLFRQGKFDAARDKYHLILKNHPDETYVLLKFAESCVESFRSGVSDAAQKKGLVEKAFSHFQRVLRVDSTNPYAVNGMGVVLALTGFGNAAMEMFRLVQECNPHVLDAWLNMGHTHCALKEYASAIEVFQQAATLLGDSSLDPEVHLHLARAFYLKGDFRKAERMLQRALRLVPSNRDLKFNLALVLKAMAIVTLKDKESALLAVENAVGQLRMAEAIFRALIVECREEGKTLIDQKRLRKEAAVTFNFLNQSASHLDRAQRMQALAAKKQKRTANQLLLPDHFPIRKNDRGKREAASASSSGTKGKMARQQARAEDYSPMRKRSHKNAQLEEGLMDFKQVLSNTQREPQRKRVKAVLGDGNDRRRRRFADRKRRELEIERTTVSSDEDLSPKFRPLRRRGLTTQTGNVSEKKVVALRFEDSSDACSTADMSDNAENQMFIFPVQRDLISGAVTRLMQPPHQSAPQKRLQSSSEKPTSLKKFLKSLSDEADSVDATSVQLTALKRNLSDGDQASLPVKEAPLDSCQVEGLQPVPSSPSADLQHVPVIPLVDSDDSAKRQNTDSEPESRKRKSSLHLC